MTMFSIYLLRHNIRSCQIWWASLFPQLGEHQAAVVPGFQMDLKISRCWHLGIYEASLDGVWSNLVWWKVPLPMTNRCSLRSLPLYDSIPLIPKAAALRPLLTEIVTHHTQRWTSSFQVPTANPLPTFVPRGTQILPQPESDTETCSISCSWVISTHKIICLDCYHCSHTYSQT